MHFSLFAIIAATLTFGQGLSAQSATDAQDIVQPPAMVGDLTADPILKLGFDNALAETDPVPDKFLLTLNILQIAVSNSFRSMRIFFAATQVNPNRIANEAHGFLSTLRWCAASVESIECIPERHVESILFSIELLLSNVVQKVLSQILMRDTLYDIAEVVVPQTVDTVNRITAHLADLQNQGLSDLTMSDIYQINKALDEIATQVVVYNEWFERNEEDESTSEYIEPAVFPIVPQPQSTKSLFLNRTGILSVQTVSQETPRLTTTVRSTTVITTAIAATKSTFVAKQASASMAALLGDNLNEVTKSLGSGAGGTFTMNLPMAASPTAFEPPVSSISRDPPTKNIETGFAAGVQKGMTTTWVSGPPHQSFSSSTAAFTMKSSFARATTQTPVSTTSSTKTATEVSFPTNGKSISTAQNTTITSASVFTSATTSYDSTLRAAATTSNNRPLSIVEVHSNSTSTSTPVSTLAAAGESLVVKNNADKPRRLKLIAVWPLVGLVI